VKPSGDSAVPVRRAAIAMRDVMGVSFLIWCEQTSIKQSRGQDRPAPTLALTKPYGCCNKDTVGLVQRSFGSNRASPC